MDQQIGSVWYASKEKIESMTKLIVFDDRGTLQLSPGEFQFVGGKQRLKLRDISDVGLVNQTINWVTYLVTIVLVIVFMVSTGTSLTASIVIALVAAVAGLLIGSNTKWVRVAYRDEGGAAREAYFADGSKLGWGGILGGTGRLCETLKLQQAAPG